jgi:hypothetical protein
MSSTGRYNLVSYRRVIMPYIVPVATNDIFEIRLVGNLHGQVCINTFRYVMDRASGTGTIDMEPMLDDFRSAVWANLRNCMSVEYSGAKLFIQKIAPVRLVSFESVLDPGAGDVAGTSAPSTVTMVFRRKLLLAGRRYQGRVFIPGVPTANILNSQLTAAFLASQEVEDTFVGMLDVLEAQVGIEGIPSLAVPNGTSWDNRGAINAIELDPVLRSQRRREVGRGI